MAEDDGMPAVVDEAERQRSGRSLSERARSFRVLINPRAGGMSGRRLGTFTDRIKRSIEGAHQRLDVVASHGDVGRSLDELLADHNFDVLMVAAGDGTLRSVAERLLYTPVALAPLPMGTVNLLARDLDMPNDPENAVERLVTGTVEQMDIARINEELFLSCCAFGLAADVCEIRETVREAEVSQWGSVIFDVARRVVDSRPMRMVVDDGRRRRRLRTHVVFVSNSPFQRAGPLLMRRGRLDTGRLALYAQRQPTRWHALLTLFRSGFGGFRGPEVLNDSIERLRIVSRPERLTVTIDGEITALNSPFEFSIEPRALSILRPPKQNR